MSSSSRMVGRSPPSVTRPRAATTALATTSDRSRRAQGPRRHRHRRARAVAGWQGVRPADGVSDATLGQPPRDGPRRVPRGCGRAHRGSSGLPSRATGSRGRRLRRTSAHRGGRWPGTPMHAAGRSSIAFRLVATSRISSGASTVGTRVDRSWVAATVRVTAASSAMRPGGSTHRPCRGEPGRQRRDAAEEDQQTAKPGSSVDERRDVTAQLHLTPPIGQEARQHPPASSLLVDELLDLGITRGGEGHSTGHRRGWRCAVQC